MNKNEKDNNLLESYENMKSVLETAGIIVSNYITINYGIQFTVSKSNCTGFVRIYQNKKSMIKIDYSQLPADLALIIKGLVKETDRKEDKRDIIEHDLKFPVIGTDESGKGDYFGPLVSAAVYVDAISAKKLIYLGVKDSKKLSDNQNILLAKKISEEIKGKFVVVEISPERYNTLYFQFKDENKNLNVLLAWSHAKAIEELLSKVDCNTAIVDQFADEVILCRKLQAKGKELTIIQRHGAERNIAVAAASILARARFLDKLNKLSKYYNINLPKGSSENTIRAGRLFIKQYGPKSLNKVAKMHFKTTEIILGDG